MALKFGLIVPQGWRMDLVGIPDPVEAYETMTRVAQEAEALGFDSIWLFDHFHTVPTPTQEVTFECWTSTAALARDTQRVHIGQMVTCNGGHLDVEGLEHKFSILKRHCDEVGRDYNSIRRTVLFNCAIAETDEEAMAKSRPFQRNIPSGRIREQALVGTPDVIRKRLEEIEQAGAQEIILYMPDSARLEAVRMFARECMRK